MAANAREAGHEDGEEAFEKYRLMYVDGLPFVLQCCTAVVLSKMLPSSRQ